MTCRVPLPDERNADSSRLGRDERPVGLGEVEGPTRASELKDYEELLVSMEEELRQTVVDRAAAQAALDKASNDLRDASSSVKQVLNDLKVTSLADEEKLDLQEDKMFHMEQKAILRKAVTEERKKEQDLRATEVKQKAAVKAMLEHLLQVMFYRADLSSDYLGLTLVLFLVARLSSCTDALAIVFCVGVLSGRRST